MYNRFTKFEKLYEIIFIKYYKKKKSEMLWKIIYNESDKNKFNQ